MLTDASPDTASASVRELKTHEEYLVEFEKALLAAVPELYKSMDKDLIVAYGLAGALVMFDWSAATEFTFLGAKFSASVDQIFILVPLVVALIYLLITYQLFRLAGMYRSVRDTAAALCKVNAQARPIDLTDMHHFESGVAGLILALSRWQATSLLRRNPFVSPKLASASSLPALALGLVLFLKDILSWATSLVTRSAWVLALLLMPVILSANAVYSRSLTTWPPPLAPVVVFVALALAGILTLAFVFVLFAAYFVDLLHAVRSDLEKSAAGILQSFVGVVTKRATDWVLKGPLWPFS